MNALAQWNGRLYLVHANENIVGVNLATPFEYDAPSPPFQSSRFGVYFANFRSPDGITFYPELRYKGAKVYPEAWVQGTTEPILRCRLMGWDAQSVGYTMEQRRADGWKYADPRDGGTRHLHVDELEKIEGPPPEGVF